MDRTQQSAAEYYKTHRKRSVISRITILSSMAILLLVLAVNISVLYSQDKSTTQSHASTPQNVENLLPSLPNGCAYVHIGGKIKVDCPRISQASTSPAPTGAVTIPINVVLPQLPPQCSFAASTNGSVVQCSTPHTPIPTVPVNLPATCVAAGTPNSATCTYGNNQTVTQPLPKLPEGCSYFLEANKYYVVCEAK